MASLVDATDVENVKAAMKPNTKVVASNIHSGSIIVQWNSELLTWLTLCCKCQFGGVP